MGKLPVADARTTEEQSTSKEVRAEACRSSDGCGLSVAGEDRHRRVPDDQFAGQQEGARTELSSLYRIKQLTGGELSQFRQTWVDGCEGRSRGLRHNIPIVEADN